MRYVGSCSSVNISKYYLFLRPAKVCVEQQCPKHAKDLVCHIAKWYFSIRPRYFLYIIPYVHIPVCTLAICIYCKLKCIHGICTLSTDYSYCLICCVLTQCIATSIHAQSILLLFMRQDYIIWGEKWMNGACWPCYTIMSIKLGSHWAFCWYHQWWKEGYHSTCAYKLPIPSLAEQLHKHR